MNEIEEALKRAVAERSSFGVDDVAGRVVRRRRRRRRRGAGGGLVAVAIVATFAFAGNIGEDIADVDTIEQPDDPSRLAPLENPVGADSVRGELDDVHVEATDLRGLLDCAQREDTGPPDDVTAEVGEAIIESLRNAGLHSRAYVSSSNGGMSLEGVPFVGLSRRYGPTLDFLAANLDTDEFCVELPRVGAYNEAPGLAAIEFSATRGPLPDAAVVVTIGDGCAPKAVWQATVVRDLPDRVEVGHLLGASDGIVWLMDCGPMETVDVEVPFARDGRPVVAATDPSTIVLGAVVPGGVASISFGPHNVAGDAATMGDDLIAQNVGDPSIQFQVSDVFSDVPIASAPRPVFTDQWPLTGKGNIAVPADVPAGTYQVHFIHHPEINGVLEVVASTENPALPESEWGWRIPDIDGDGLDDVIDGPTGAVLLAVAGGFVELLDSDGGPIAVPVAGREVFACVRSAELWRYRADAMNTDFALRTARLDVDDELVGTWAWQPSFFFDDAPDRLPPRGKGCEPFGPIPVVGLVADGPVSDIHVEATDLVFPECVDPVGDSQLLPSRRAELQSIYDVLLADGLLDPIDFLLTSSISPADGRIQIGLYRRYGPTIEWLVERVDIDDLCFWLLPPIGAFAGPPSLLEWEVVGDSPPSPDDSRFSVRSTDPCGVREKELLLPPQIAAFGDRVEIAIPLVPGSIDSFRLVCVAPDVFEIKLHAPLGDREIVATPSAVTMHPSPVVSTDQVFAVLFDPIGLGDETTMGDDVMIQNVDDPSIQIQVSGVFTDTPTAGPPAPIVQDRWTPTGIARLVVPAGTPPGEYTFIFIEHPQFNGTFTLE